MAEENDGEPVDDLALMKRAYTNKKTGQIDDGVSQPGPNSGARRSVSASNRG
ncbi:unnamed protein product [Brassica oleracea var. botrytis]